MRKHVFLQKVRDVRFSHSGNISVGGYLYKPWSLADIMAIKSQDSIFSKTFQMQAVGDVYVAEPGDFTSKHPWYQEFTSFHKRFPSIPW